MAAGDLNFVADQGAKTLEIAGKFVGISGAVREDVSTGNGRAGKTATQGITGRGTAGRGWGRAVRRGGLPRLLPGCCAVRALARSRLTRCCGGGSVGVWRLRSARRRSLRVCGSGRAALSLRRRTGGRCCVGRGGLSEGPGCRQEHDGKQCRSGFHSLSLLQDDFLLSSRLG